MAIRRKPIVDDTAPRQADVFDVNVAGRVKDKDGCYGMAMRPIRAFSECVIV